jgi:hypothetical protein
MSDATRETVSTIGGLAAGAGASMGTMAIAASGATTATGASLAGAAATTTGLCAVGGSLLGGVVVVGAVGIGVAYGAYRGISALWDLFFY